MLLENDILDITCLGNALLLQNKIEDYDDE